MLNYPPSSYPNSPSTNHPINHTSKYASSEAGPLRTQRGSSSSQRCSSSDVPELYHDQELSTPPSTTSSHLLYTPPHGWSATAPTSSLQDTRNGAFTQPPSKLVPFDTSRGARPTVPPINTNFNWRNNPQPESVEPSMLFANYDSSPSYHTNSNLYYRPSLNTLPIRNTHPSSSSSSGSVPLSPFSHVSPSEPQRSSHPVQQTPLKLHQPRPSRRIPIVSLSTLASGCDGFSAQPSNNEQTSEELLSPLPLEFNAPATSALRIKREYYTQHNAKPSQHTGYVPTFGSSGDSGKVIMCSCGCMESYTFH